MDTGGKFLGTGEVRIWKLGRQYPTRKMGSWPKCSAWKHRDLRLQEAALHLDLQGAGDATHLPSLITHTFPLLPSSHPFCSANTPNPYHLRAFASAVLILEPTYHLYSFPMAAATKGPRLWGFKQQTFILLCIPLGIKSSRFIHVWHMPVSLFMVRGWFLGPMWSRTCFLPIG